MSPPRGNPPGEPRPPRWWLPAFLLAGGVVLFAVARGVELYGGPVLSRVEGLFVDAAFRVRNRYGVRPRPDPRLAPLRIERDSIRRFGRWPWPRDLHARLLTAHQDELRPRGVAFDILFRGTSTPEADAGFEAGLQRLGNVALAVGVGLTGDREEARSRLEGKLEAERWERHTLPAPPPRPGQEWVKRVSAPLGTFADAARHLGHIRANPDPDRVYRRFHPFVRIGDRLLPSLALVAACMALDLPLERVSLEGGELVMRPGGELAEERRFPLRPDGSMLINWVDRYGRGFRPVRALELEESPDADLLARARDRVWIVGVAGLEVDMGPSPLQTQEIPLFETHLHAANTLVSGQAIREVRGPTMWFLGRVLAVLCWTLMPLAALRLPPLAGAFIGLAPLLIYPIFGFLLFSRAWILVEFATPWIFYAGSYLGLLGYYLLVVERLRQRSRDRHARFFDGAALEAVLADAERGHLRGRRAELTVLFANLDDFSSVVEELDPEVLGELLGEHFDALSGVVFHHGGTLDKYLGDGLMAFWGEPLPLEDHADRALAAAREMVAVTDALSARWEERLGRPLRLRIGVNSGRATVGNLGGSRLQYTAMGPPVKRAQRLQQLAGAGEVLVGEETRDACREPPSMGESRELDGLRAFPLSSGDS